MHTIRLRRPWTRIAHRFPASEPVIDHKVDVPDSDGVPRASDVTYQRRFNRPTGLAPDDRVLLRIEAWKAATIRVILNDAPLFTRDVSHTADSVDAGVTLDISNTMQSSNSLAIELGGTDVGPPALIGAVSLQIDSPASHS
ncbi:hypothetical protein FYK55_09565 [Roseiconus nitratireducens]|uniref:Uncharacterized protein n=1 Tax=Roseiconus nitratireducens TaxID=2605748 RepID=A0A5M6DAH7_9BACT|nr:hypothetical protein [Roseiconus nitratireducens]KAA5544557.1 hypothetical protein FYK55_09565 [Roseiconus nitratireducens]